MRKGINIHSPDQSVDRCMWATLRQFIAQVLRLKDVTESIYGSKECDTICKASDTFGASEMTGLGASKLIVP